MRRQLVAGNWKMNGSRGFAAELANGVVAGVNAGVAADVAICPPFPLLDTVGAAIGASAVALGAQDLARQENGAFTGEVSGEMLTDAGCHFVLVGHSERRALFGEDNETVAVKFVRAQAAGLVPILCLGEQLEDREGGITEQVVGAQLDAVIEAAGVSAFAGAVIAYEPVWAIGSGLTASPEQAQDVHAFIRARLAASEANIAQATRILYGGSVKPDNAGELFAKTDIDGGLIGGAALKAEDFLGICRAAN